MVVVDALNCGLRIDAIFKKPYTGADILDCVTQLLFGEHSPRIQEVATT